MVFFAFADIFNRNSPGDYGVGINIYGDEIPVEASFERLNETDKNLFDKGLKGGGDGFAGIVTYKPGKLSKERSYITIPFVSGKDKLKMTKGMKYCVEFWVSLGESSKYASNNIQMLFSKDLLKDIPLENMPAIIARRTPTRNAQLPNKLSFFAILFLNMYLLSQYLNYISFYFLTRFIQVYFG